MVPFALKTTKSVQAKASLKHMKETCKNLFRPFQVLSSVEGMVTSKGRFVFHQYLPKKLTKWGAKGFALCDVKTSYLVDLN